MKFTILGFSQKQAVNMGLSVDELLVLRWFVDFYGSKRIIKISTEDGTYAWVNYQGLLDDMPIISCNKRHLAERFQRLSDAGVLKHKTIRQGGVFSAFAFGPNYQALIDDSRLQDLEGDSPKADVPSSENGRTLSPKTDEQKINLQNKINLQEEESREKTEDKSSGTPYSSIQYFYSSICKSYPKLTKLSDARKKAIHARFAAGYKMEDFKRLFEMAEASSFLKGANNRNWQATFDWLIKDANMAKVLDGNYADKDAPTDPDDNWGGIPKL